MAGMRQFNGMDSLFLYMDAARAGMHGAFLQIYAPVAGEDASLRYQRLLRHIERRLDASPVFRRAIVRAPLEVDHAWWVDGVEVDLRYHVSRSALPQPGNKAQLAEAYARIYEQPMDMSRPLWEIHVIDGVNAVPGVPDNGFALVVKFHHAGADGVSATEITSALHRSDAQREEFAPQSRPAVPLPPPPSLQVALRRSAELSTQFGKALGREFKARLPGLGRSLLKRALAKQVQAIPATRGRKEAAPRTLVNVELTPGRTYTWEALSFDAIRHIRAQVPEATVNDVYLAVVGGALRRFLLDRDGLPAASLIGAVPVNVRIENERGQAGNQFTIMPVPLRTDEPDALRRLQRITEQAARAKTSMRGGGGRKSANWFKIVPAPVLAIAGGALRVTRLTARMAPLFNLVVTNVPGPRETLYLDGAQLLDINGAPPVMDGLGLIIAASSYDDALRVAVAGCRSVMPEPEKMSAYLRQSFVELGEACGVQVAPVAVRKPRSGGRKTRK